jgi:hypothetical protein
MTQMNAASKQNSSSRFPLLEQLLSMQEMAIQPLYKTSDIARIFGVSIRSIQNYITAGRMSPRNLPGRAKFLPQDIEAFLDASKAALPR